MCQNYLQFKSVFLPKIMNRRALRPPLLKFHIDGGMTSSRLIRISVKFIRERQSSLQWEKYSPLNSDELEQLKKIPCIFKSLKTSLLEKPVKSVCFSFPMECQITRIIQYFNLQQLRGTTLQANKHQPLFWNFSDKGTYTYNGYIMRPPIW